MVTQYSSLNSSPQDLSENSADLCVSFAQKYLQKLKSSSPENQVVEHRFLEQRRQSIAQRMLTSLRSVSAKSWTKTETLLAKEILRHGIDADLIDPWEISGGIHRAYKYAVEAYAEQQPPPQLATKVSHLVGQTRQQVTAIDPRAISFVAMQYHYTGIQLMELLPEGEQENFASYAKVIDDHLYMPLQRAYQAAARHSLDSLALQSVRLLMSMVDRIAARIVHRVIELYPRYRSHSGLLSEHQVRTSSVRDVEMFQVYMWVCLLEGNLQALQEELFPLCVMIYPRLNVSWELVSMMTTLLRKEVASCLPPEQMKCCEPYYQSLLRMFSPEVFQMITKSL